ncbi:MAG: hypothetical protein HY893_09305 [Deltaproteobacteria bacterium]|nr:hypothetical protein [Deltaproteobacteria bacterium]
MERSLSNSITAGAISGIIWGWLALAVNSFTGVFPLEAGFLSALASFTIGGAVFGVASAGFLFAAARLIPFRSVVFKAIAVSTSIWIVLRAGGAVLSGMEPGRYHFNAPEALQGLLLAVLLGAVLGLFWKSGFKGTIEAE